MTDVDLDLLDYCIIYWYRSIIYRIYRLYRSSIGQISSLSILVTVNFTFIFYAFW